MEKIDISKCKITRFPAKVLIQKAKPVEEINDNIREFAYKMLDIMVETQGIGLAAPQAGVGLTMFVVNLECQHEGSMFFINPKLEGSGPLTPLDEGCLSVPGINPSIKRHSKCKVTALDLDGNEFSIEADGLLAKCLQHEYDHLQGMTIAQKMGKVSQIKYRKRIQQLREEYSDQG